MREKQQPIGICDLCLEPMPRAMWYTRRGPRLYCGIDCKNTANSRNGNAIRVEKLRQRVRRGEWVNPREYLSADEKRKLQSRISQLARRREVEAGTWRNPALPDEARKKLSRPRKHRGLLHRVIEKLRHGSVADLTEREKRIHRAYRRSLKRRRG